MADQIAERDPNRVPALLIHDSTGAETRQVRASAANPNALPVEVVAGGTGSSAGQTQGTAADGEAATGNPVLVAGQYNATPPTYTDGDATTLQTDVNGNTKVREAATSSATRSNVTAATSDTQVLAANTSRTGVLVFNDSTATMYLAYGDTAASTTSYSVQLDAGAYWEMPQPVYTGALRAIWDAADGAARVTELA